MKNQIRYNIQLINRLFYIPIARASPILYYWVKSKKETQQTIMKRYGFRLTAFLVPLSFLSTRTRVCAFTADPFEAPSNLDSELQSTHMKIQPCHYRDIPRRANFRKKGSQLFGQSKNDSESASSSPRVKFSSDFTTTGDDSSLEKPLDKLLTLVASDAFSIISGIIGMMAVVTYRWNLVLASDPSRATAEALTYETRTDLLGVLAAGSVLLNGVTKLDVTTALAESVVLEGKTLAEPEQIGGNGTGNTLVWALESLLAATPAKTAVLISDNGDRWAIRCRAGVVPSSSSSLSLPEKTPILERVGSPENSKETYLPTLQALPGRTELTYLPNNTQMAVMIPIQPPSSISSSSMRNGVLVLGGNTAKSFTPRDIAWSRIVAEKLGEEL